MIVIAQWVNTPTRERLAATRKRTLHSILCRTTLQPGYFSLIKPGRVVSQD
jgi:hypothetical protein